MHGTTSRGHSPVYMHTNENPQRKNITQSMMRRLEPTQAKMLKAMHKGKSTEHNSVAFKPTFANDRTTQSLSTPSFLRNQAQMWLSPCSPQGRPRFNQPCSRSPLMASSEGVKRYAEPAANRYYGESGLGSFSSPQPRPVSVSARTPFQSSSAMKQTISLNSPPYRAQPPRHQDPYCRNANPLCGPYPRDFSRTWQQSGPAVAAPRQYGSGSPVHPAMLSQASCPTFSRKPLSAHPSITLPPITHPPIALPPIGSLCKCDSRLALRSPCVHFGTASDPCVNVDNADLAAWGSVIRDFNMVEYSLEKDPPSVVKRLAQFKTIRCSLPGSFERTMWNPDSCTVRIFAQHTTSPSSSLASLVRPCCPSCPDAEKKTTCTRCGLRKKREVIEIP